MVEAAFVVRTGGEDHRHPLALEPAGHELEGRGRRVVEPVGVVDEAEHRGLVGRRREQAEHAEEDQEPARTALRGLPERRPHRTRLHLGQLVGAVEHRLQQPLQRGEGQRRLRLDALGGQHPRAGRAAAHLGEQCRLADSGLAVQDECTTAPLGRVREQPRHPRQLGLPPLQHSRILGLGARKGPHPWGPRSALGEPPRVPAGAADDQRCEHAHAGGHDDAQPADVPRDDVGDHREREAEQDGHGVPSGTRPTHGHARRVRARAGPKAGPTRSGQVLRPGAQTLRLTGKVAIQVIAPRRTTTAGHGQDPAQPPVADPGAHAGEEQHHGVEHDGQHVVAGPLDVGAHLGRRRLGRGVEPLGLLLATRPGTRAWRTAWAVRPGR